MDVPRISDPALHPLVAVQATRDTSVRETSGEHETARPPSWMLPEPAPTSVSSARKCISASAPGSDVTISSVPVSLECINMIFDRSAERVSGWFT